MQSISIVYEKNHTKTEKVIKKAFQVERKFK